MIEESLLRSNHIGKDGFIWWVGQVAPRAVWWAQSNMSIPGNWGARCKVRIIGYHPFDGNILEDNDLPWAHIMFDPSVGGGNGGIGETQHLRGGETVIGFFLDGEDGQQPVIVGVLYRSEETKNLITPEVIAKEKSSRFKPFTGHPNKVVKPTQKNARESRKIPIGEVPPQTTTSTTPPSNFTGATGQRETPPFTTDVNFLSYAGVGVTFDSSVGYAGTADVSVFNRTDMIAGLYPNSPAESTAAVEKVADITVTLDDGCKNNLIGRITQYLRDFMAVTNGLDKYLDVYIDPVLNTFVDIQNIISSSARIIGGVVKLILNNLRDTIFKCLSWAFRRLVGTIIPLPQQTIVLEATKNILDKVFCIIEKLVPDLISNIENLLGDLVDKIINVPICAAEQWTASILSNVMSTLEDSLNDILSGVSWLTGNLGNLYGILNQANSLGSQIFNFLECTGQVCSEPRIWASKFGVQEQQSDNWNKIVDKVNIFNDVSSNLATVDSALSQIPMYGNNVAFSECNQRVYNPVEQDDLMPAVQGTKYSVCIPPTVKIVGDGVGARALAIVGVTSSIFSVEVLNGGTGYSTRNTTVSIVDNSGYGKNARAEAIIGAGGSIRAIYLKDKGEGYCRGNYSILLPTAGTTAQGTQSISGTGDVLTNQSNQINLNSIGITTTYKVSIAEEYVYEGESFTATLLTENAKNGEIVPYTITGVSQDKIEGGLKGNFVIQNNISTIKFKTNQNNILGDDSVLRITAKGSSDLVGIRNKVVIGGGNTTIVPEQPLTPTLKYTLSSNTNSLNRGESAIITLKTENVKNGTRVTYRITGVDQNDISNNLTGAFVVTSNQASIKLDTLKYNNSEVKLMTLSLDNRKSNVSIRINSYKESSTGISTFIFGCLDELIVISPGYGYTTGDKVTDGVNTWELIVSPSSGAVVGAKPLKDIVCGYTDLPEVFINTNTGVGAEVVPRMRYTPVDNTLIQEQQRLINLSGIAVTSVVDCV